MQSTGLSPAGLEALLGSIKTAVRGSADRKEHATGSIESESAVEEQPSLQTSLAAMLQVSRSVSLRSAAEPPVSPALTREVNRHTQVISESIPRLRAAVEQLQV